MESIFFVYIYSYAIKTLRNLTMKKIGLLFSLYELIFH